MLKSLLVIIAALLLPTALTSAKDTSTWEFRDGAWREIQPQPSTQPGAEIDQSVLDEAEQLLARGRHREARRLLLKWERLNRPSPARDRALLLLADSYYQYGDKVRAFYHLDELMDTYPDSTLYHPALEKQFQIAEDFLYGYHLRVLGLPMITAPEHGVEMLFRIQQRSPGSPLAERALIRTADHYYAWSDYYLAADAYGAYVRSYPRSPVVLEARLRRAFCYLAEFRGVKYDATPLVDARAQLVALSGDDATFAAQNGVPQIIEQIDAALAEKIYFTADFFRRTREPKAAVYNYRYLQAAYPDSPQAARANAVMARMPAEALADPAPAPGEGYTPTLPQPDLLAP